MWFTLLFQPDQWVNDLNPEWCIKSFVGFLRKKKDTKNTILFTQMMLEGPGVALSKTGGILSLLGRVLGGSWGGVGGVEAEKLFWLERERSSQGASRAEKGPWLE